MHNFVLLLLVLFAGVAKATSPMAKSMQKPCAFTSVSASVPSGNTYTSIACLHGRSFKLVLNTKARRVFLIHKSLETTLHRIRPGFDPEVVGAGKFNAFLPEDLQPYLDKNILLYTTAVRTNGGNGGGQYGSGVEIFIHALDTRPVIPKTVSKILIGSCERTIELADFKMSLTELGDVSVVNNRLSLQFVNYGKRAGNLKALISIDYSRIDFESMKPPIDS